MVQARYNEEKHGIELLFDEKPDQAIRDAIKAAGFRWYKPGGYWLIDSDGQQIHRDYIEWGNAEKTEAIRKKTAAARYDWMIEELNGYGVDYHNVDQKAISAALISKVDAIKRIMNAFNHDDSNGMVDYFDTHFYENIRLIAA